MTRFLIAAAVAVVLLGSVALCQLALTREVEVRFSREVHGHGEPQLEESGVEYELVVTPSFDAKRDPFQLTDDVAGDAIRVRITAVDTVLLAWREDVARGVPIRVDGVSIADGRGEWFVEATPSPRDAADACALRIQVFRDGVLHEDATIWSDGGGAPLARRVEVDLRPARLRLDRGLGKGSSA